MEKRSPTVIIGSYLDDTMRREITGDDKLIIGLITAICLLINEPETNDTGIVELPLIGCSD